jgi:hypothetical protein
MATGIAMAIRAANLSFIFDSPRWRLYAESFFALE